MVKTNFQTEAVHPRADELDRLSTLEFLELMSSEDAAAAAAVRSALPSLAGVVDEVARRLAAGGRLRYVGAGSSGRLAELDASECPATFGVPPDLVVCHTVAGGAAEDDELGGRTALASASALDAVVGISASGATPFVLGGLAAARERGAYTVAMVGNEGSALASLADTSVVVATGPEVVAGSTRLKAGTAQKLVLNMLSTAAFQRLGHLYRGRMVAVVADNRKLWARTARIVGDLAGCEPGVAEAALREAAGDARVAVVMLTLELGAGEARACLDACGGRLADALAGRQTL